MRIIEYFEQTTEMQNKLREQIVQGDWRAAKYLYEVLEQGKMKERYGERARLILLVETGLQEASAEASRGVSEEAVDGEPQPPKLLAFCTLAERDEIVEEEMTPDMKLWVGFVYTFPEYRGNRYSERLINHACALAKQEGYENVYLSSNEVGLYEKYGFVFQKRLHTVWGEETQVFEKELRDEQEGCGCNERNGGR